MKTQTVSAAFAGQRILLVDDVPQGTVARKSVLIGLGYEVETAENGFAALQLLERQAFHLMVTDYKMPGMDGVELIRIVRATQPETKIILLSAMAETLGFTEETSGADAVLPKCGTELSQLTRTVKKLLTRKPVRKPVASQQKPPLIMVKSS